MVMPPEQKVGGSNPPGRTSFLSLSRLALPKNRPQTFCSARFLSTCRPFLAGSHHAGTRLRDHFVGRVFMAKLLSPAPRAPRSAVVATRWRPTRGVGPRLRLGALCGTRLVVWRPMAGWGRTAAPKRMSRVIWLEQRGGGARSQKLAAPQHRRQGRPGNNLSTGRSRPSG